MPDFVSTMRFLEVGKEPPKNSSFTGKVTAASIFGDWSNGTGAGKSVFGYDERFIDYDNTANKNETDGSLVGYTSRFVDDKNTDVDNIWYDDETKYNKTYTNMGFLETKEESDNFRKIGYDLNNKDGSLVWECIISLKDVTTADRYGLYGQKDFAAVTDKVLYKFFKDNGFKADNMMFWMDYHENESKKGDVHPHIHLHFFEIEKERTKGMFTAKAFTDLKRDFAIELAKRENLHTLKYDEYRSKGDEYKQSIISAAKAADFKKIKDVNDLYRILPKTGRLQYNSYQMLPYKDAINRTVDTFLRAKDIKPKYDSLIEQLEAFDKLIDDKAGTKVSKHKENELKKLYERIGNTILQGKKDDTQDYNKHLKKSSYRSIAFADIKRINALKKEDPVNEQVINDAYKELFNKLKTNLETLSAFDTKELANLTYKGQGTPKDLNLAISYMNMAISRLNQNDTFSQCKYNNFLSKLYFEKGDKENGMKCLKVSSSLGDNHAEYLYGVHEAKGDGINQNIESGLLKITDASDRGDREATKWLRSNGYRANGSARLKSSQTYPITRNKNHSARHRHVFSSVEWIVNDHQREVQRAIEDYLRSNRDYENYDYTL